MFLEICTKDLDRRSQQYYRDFYKLSARQPTSWLLRCFRLLVPFVRWMPNEDCNALIHCFSLNWFSRWFHLHMDKFYICVTHAQFIGERKYWIQYLGKIIYGIRDEQGTRENIKKDSVLLERLLAWLATTFIENERKKKTVQTYPFRGRNFSVSSPRLQEKCGTSWPRGFLIN